ncbi:MAG: hypothetical protein EWM73_01208 [Nitrospira sp.]|nr:MAG: hypothetical protein EWM73_01208 [Nitrospira sp.]
MTVQQRSALIWTHTIAYATKEEFLVSDGVHNDLGSHRNCRLHFCFNQSTCHEPLETGTFRNVLAVGTLPNTMYAPDKDYGHPSCPRQS